MDIETLVNDKTIEAGNLIGLYIINQSGLKPPYDDGYFRCGAAGIRETRGSSLGSNLRSRAAMYLNDWISGGRIWAFLTVPRSIFQGFSERVLTDDKAGYLENFARAGSTRLAIREREFHAKLEAMGIPRVRGGRTEFFKGRLTRCIAALKSIGVGTFYRWGEDGRLLEREVLRRNADLSVTKHTHRASPRLETVELQVSREVRQLLTKSPELLGQLANAASDPRVDKIRISRRNMSRVTRSQKKK